MGKTILPGLIDVHVHLGAPGGFYPDKQQLRSAEEACLRELAAYLYSGVTTVRSVGDGLDSVLKVRSTVNDGEALGAELFTCGPMFTRPAGTGPNISKTLPPNIRANAEKQFLAFRLPPKKRGSKWTI